MYIVLSDLEVDIAQSLRRSVGTRATDIYRHKSGPLCCEGGASVPSTLACKKTILSGAIVKRRGSGSDRGKSDEGGPEAKEPQ